MTVRVVVVDMQNRLFSDAVSQILSRFDSDFQVYQAESPDQTEELCMDTRANILIMEVTAYAPWTLEERLSLRNCVKSRDPACKVVLVVDETVEKKLADSVRRAKKDGLIDNFIYGSVSATYLTAVIDTL